MASLNNFFPKVDRNAMQVAGNSRRYILLSSSTKLRTFSDGFVSHENDNDDEDDNDGAEADNNDDADEGNNKDDANVDDDEDKVAAEHNDDGVNEDKDCDNNEGEIKSSTGDSAVLVEKWTKLEDEADGEKNEYENDKLGDKKAEEEGKTEEGEEKEAALMIKGFKDKLLFNSSRCPDVFTESEFLSLSSSSSSFLIIFVLSFSFALEILIAVVTSSIFSFEAWYLLIQVPLERLCSTQNKKLFFTKVP